MEAKDVDGPWEEWRGGVWTTTDELVCNPSNFDGKRRAIARRIVKEHNSHAALVEALKAALVRFGDLNGLVSAEVWNGNYEAITACRGALALAGETP